MNGPKEETTTTTTTTTPAPFGNFFLLLTLLCYSLFSFFSADDNLLACLLTFWTLVLVESYLLEHYKFAVILCFLCTNLKFMGLMYDMFNWRAWSKWLLCISYRTRKTNPKMLSKFFDQHCKKTSAWYSLR